MNHRAGCVCGDCVAPILESAQLAIDDSLRARTLDRTKPIWVVRGYLPSPDYRGMTCFVNANTSSEAVAAARAEGMDGIRHTRLITSEEILKWEAMFP